MAYISKITPLGSSTTYDLKASLLINTHVTSEAAAIPATKGLFGVYTTTSDSSGLSNDGHILSGTWHNNDSNFGYQLFIDTDPTYKMALRQRNSSGVWQAWKLIPMADGTNASGTWGISISGTANTASYLTTPNTAGFKTDQYGNFQHQSTTTTDYWTIKSKAGTDKFKVHFENGDTNINGTIYITPSLGNYREGIRIKPYDSWATIVLGGNDLSADSGTSANTWSIHNSNGSFYITRNGSSTGTAQLACVSNKWSVSGNITSPSTSCSWISGQNATNAAFNVGDATNTGSYWPWMRQTNTSSAKWFSFGTLNTSFYWIGSATSRTENGYDYGMSFNVANGYLQGCSRVYGAVWNDYAEYRITKDIIEPGRCVIETGKDDLVLSTERLQPGAEIVSDTFGFAIGETDTAKTPIATTGRVLAYIYEGREAALAAIGKPVCSGPDGTVSIMTDEEYQKYGYCAIGTISAVPDYEEWGTGKVKVNNRIWIRIR